MMHRSAIVLLLLAPACAANTDAEWLGTDGLADTTEALTSTAPYSGRAFLCELGRRRFPAILIDHMGRAEARSFTDSGATRGNAEWAAGRGDLNVESQRGAYLAIAAGVIDGGGDGPALLADGLRGLTWTFAQQGDDGSFPAERDGEAAKNSGLHAKSELIEAAARSLLLLEQCGLDDPAAAALIEPLRRSATWLASAPDTDDFLARAKNTNQRLFVSTALAEAAVVLRDDALAARAAQLLDGSLARMTADGVLPEDGGFDSGYQTVSIELLALHAATLADRRALLPPIGRALDRFLAVVRPNGTIDDSANTRTAACGEPIRGRGPKGKDVDIIPLRLFTAALLLGRLPEVHPIANRIEGAGQGFDHIDQCE